MSDQTQHRPSAARPEPNVVMGQPATVQDAADDYAAGAATRQAADAVAQRQYGQQS